MRHAITTGDEVVHRGIAVTNGAETAVIDLHVVRVNVPETLRGLYRITFAPSPHPAVLPLAIPERSNDHVAVLERELRYLKDSQRGTTEELESTNEELETSNEELQSTNEELQSSNEELETSKEELQSLNEELQSVNAQLNAKLYELSRVNDDMTKPAQRDGDRDRVRRWRAPDQALITDQATSVIRLIPSDVGRPLDDLTSTLRYDKLLDDAREGAAHARRPRDRESRANATSGT